MNRTRTVRMIAAAALGIGCLLGAGAASAATDTLPLILKQRTLVGGDHADGAVHRMSPWSRSVPSDGVSGRC
jgi:hypothetical protein